MSIHIIRGQRTTSHTLSLKSASASKSPVQRSSRLRVRTALGPVQQLIGNEGARFQCRDRRRNRAYRGPSNPRWLTTITTITADTIATDSVDLVEVNHYYDEQGRHVFDQTIFYDWCSVQCRYNVRAWRLLKSQSQLPHRDWHSGGYVATWHDGSILRKVRASSFRESWTQYDPELVERDYLPKEQRRDLYRPGVVGNP